MDDAVFTANPQYREDWKEFVRAFRDRNAHLPEVKAARNKCPLWEMTPDYEYLAPGPEPETEYPDLYFIGSAGGPIKIGISVSPQKRLRQIQTSHPYKLVLLAVVRGAAMQESEYHARFSEHRLHGEWFSPHPDILAEIDRLNPAREATLPTSTPLDDHEPPIR